MSCHSQPPVPHTRCRKWTPAATPASQESYRAFSRSTISTHAVLLLLKSFLPTSFPHLDSSFWLFKTLIKNFPQEKSLPFHASPTSPTPKPGLGAPPHGAHTGPWAHIHQILPHIVCKDMHTYMDSFLDHKIIQCQDQLFFTFQHP